MIVFLDLFGVTKAINDNKLSLDDGDLAIKYFAEQFGSIAQSIVRQYNVNAHVFRYQGCVCVCGDEFVMLFLMDPERDAKASLVQSIYDS